MVAKRYVPQYLWCLGRFGNCRKVRYNWCSQIVKTCRLKYNTYLCVTSTSLNLFENIKLSLTIEQPLGSKRNNLQDNEIKQTITYQLYRKYMQNVKKSLLEHIQTSFVC